MILKKNNYRTSYSYYSFIVLKEDKSIDFKEEQPQNIRVILVTLFVLKEDKSIEIKDLQLQNI